jgi:hypothetical protein
VPLSPFLDFWLFFCFSPRYYQIASIILRNLNFTCLDNLYMGDYEVR